MSKSHAHTVSTRRVPPGLGGLSGPSRTLEQDVELARTIAKAMDSQFSIAGMSFGFDAIVGLVPGVGDAIGFAIGLFPIYVARKHKLGKVVIGRMMANLGIDFVAGLLPVAGDALDAFFKANIKNVELLDAAMAKRQSYRARKA